MRTALLTVLAAMTALLVAARFRRQWSPTWLVLAALLGSAFLQTLDWDQGGYFVLAGLLFVVGFCLLVSSLLEWTTRGRIRVERPMRAAAGGKDFLGLTLESAQFGLTVLALVSEVVGAKRLSGSALVGLLLVVGFTYFLALVRIAPRYS